MQLLREPAPAYAHPSAIRPIFTLVMDTKPGFARMPMQHQPNRYAGIDMDELIRQQQMAEPSI